MDQTIEFYIKIGLTFLFSGLIFFVMMKLQKKKEAEAKWKADMLMKSKGVTNYEEDQNDPKN